MTEREPGEFSARQWPDWSFQGGLHRSGRERVTMSVVTSLSALGLVARAAGLGAAGERGAVALGFLAGYFLCCVLAPWCGPVSPPRWRVAIVVVLFGFGAGPAVVLADPQYLTDLTYATAITLMLVPLRYSVLVGFATAATQIGWMWLGEGRVDWRAVGVLVSVTVALGTVFALIFTIGHLRVAREQVRRMAVDQERERVARDLHDILGHSLSTMTVKLGLARRILESPVDAGPALAEVRELEGLARQALSDVRATVSDYRTVSLTAELAGARMALRAAGVRAELPNASDVVRPELQGVFGYVVREAVTNVLRHSDARTCRIRLGRDWVEITDTGSPGGDPVAGNGLTGLAERLAAVSGTLEHAGTAGGFRVLARGPDTVPG